MTKWKIKLSDTGRWREGLIFIWIMALYFVNFFFVFYSDGNYKLFPAKHIGSKKQYWGKKKIEQYCIDRESKSCLNWFFSSGIISSKIYTFNILCFYQREISNISIHLLNYTSTNSPKSWVLLDKMRDEIPNVHTWYVFYWKGFFFINCKKIERIPHHKFNTV